MKKKIFLIILSLFIFISCTNKPTKKIKTIKTVIQAQQQAVTAQRGQLTDQINNTHIIAPISGTVLEKFVECGEFVAIGKPLFNPRQRGKNLGAKLRVGRNELKPCGQVEIESCHQVGGCNGLL